MNDFQPGEIKAILNRHRVARGWTWDELRQHLGIAAVPLKAVKQDVPPEKKPPDP